jgi:hypothetical protein
VIGVRQVYAAVLRVRHGLSDGAVVQTMVALAVAGWRPL